jgi:putative MATE family efflux protein
MNAISLRLKRSRIFDFDTFQKILRQWFPNAVSSIGLQSLTLVDLLIISSLGEHALSAASSMSFVFLLIQSIFIGFFIVVRTECSQAMGAKNLKQAHICFSTSVLICTCISLVLMTLLLSLASYIAQGYVTDISQSNFAEDYLVSRIWGLPFMALGLCLSGYLVSCGLSSINMYRNISINIFNLVTTYFAVEQGYGVAGAGFATALSHIVGNILFALYSVVRFISLEKIQLEGMRPMLMKAVTVGLSQFLFIGYSVVLLAMIANISATSLLIASLVMRISRIYVIPIRGLGSVTGAITGKAVGANDKQAIRVILYTALTTGVLVYLLLALVFWPFLADISALFVDDGALIVEISQLLFLVLLEAPLAVFMSLFTQTLFGMGQHQTVLKYTAVYHWLILLPLMAFLASLGMETLVLFWSVQLVAGLGYCCYLFFRIKGYLFD